VYNIKSLHKSIVSFEFDAPQPNLRVTDQYIKSHNVLCIIKGHDADGAFNLSRKSLCIKCRKCKVHIHYNGYFMRRYHNSNLKRNDWCKHVKN
jgi:hypothetical protein